MNLVPARRFKPASSFFRKIVIGAIGAKAVRNELNELGCKIVELERGATDTKIWKDVKRKRVRIPDLVCLKTGIRVECRAKTNRSLSMSHSPTDAERAWDFGMVDEDIIAFPICKSVDTEEWSSGRLENNISYWNERNREKWEKNGKTNYFKVGDFRQVTHDSETTKGAVEASETSLEWAAKFSTRRGTVTQANDQKVSIERESDGHTYTWSLDPGEKLRVSVGDNIQKYEVFASSVPPISPQDFASKELKESDISKFLESRERTMRFTGVKLARLRNESVHEPIISDLAQDPEEDLYVRLESLSYLSSVMKEPVSDLFKPYLESGDPQTRLEAVICVGEVGTESAINTLATILEDKDNPTFIRSAAAWSLGHIEDKGSQETLIRSFKDQALKVKEQALRSLVSLGDTAIPQLIKGLTSENEEVMAGCAEALRQYQNLSADQIKSLVTQLNQNEPSTWVVWLIGNLPKEPTKAAIAETQELDEHIHFALSLLWSFTQSWISQHWELNPKPEN